MLTSSGVCQDICTCMVMQPDSKEIGTLFHGLTEKTLVGRQLCWSP